MIDLARIAAEAAAAAAAEAAAEAEAGGGAGAGSPDPASPVPPGAGPAADTAADNAGDAAGHAARQGRRPTALSPEAWRALRHAMARLALDLVSGPAGAAAVLRQGLLDQPYNTPSLPLDIG
jgi:hypothetical protein